jgi:putative toxin-antitoxin system antitoxin component (TIGR02293 family)
MASIAATGRIYQVLGGKKVLREPARHYGALIDRVHAGLPYGALESVADRFEISRADLVRILHVPLRTLARRKRERILRADESDRLLRLGRIAAMAEEVLGAREKAAAWLNHPNEALGGLRPLDRLDTDMGARQVEQILGRIAHGVYS